MYMQYPDMYSSRYVTNEDELVEQIRSAKRLRKTEKACRDYVADMCDGHSCERICKLIEEMNNDGA
jgi:UDP-N-acetylglucosamine 2-epimerase